MRKPPVAPQPPSDEVPWISREEWGARRPYEGLMKLHPLRWPATHLQLTTTGAERCSKKKCQALVKQLQVHQMADLDYPDIQYNFLVGGNGKIYEGRGTKYEPGRPGDMSGLPARCVDIAFIGDYGMKHNDDPKAHMLNAAEILKRYLIKIGVLRPKPILISFMRPRRYKKELVLPGNEQIVPPKPNSIKSRKTKLIAKH